MYEPAQELWWSRIHGPRQFRRDIQDILLSLGKGAWLQGDIPWQETLQRLVRHKLGESNGQLCLTFRTAEEIPQDPAALIFQLNPEARSRYMPGKPLAEYIQEGRLLETHILWLTGLEAERDAAWFALSRDLAKFHTGFQIVCQGHFGNKKHQNLTLLRTQDYFTEFDRLLFAMQLAAESGVSSDLQTYYSYLAVELSRGQAEAIPRLMDAPGELALRPEAEGMDRDELTQAVHKVQVRVLLPILEDRQERLVDELSDQLRRLLPFQDEHGREFRELYEVELRHMHHLKKTSALRLTLEQEVKLERLYDLRNLVAHRKIVPGEDVIDFLC